MQLEPPLPLQHVPPEGTRPCLKAGLPQGTTAVSVSTRLPGLVDIETALVSCGRSALSSSEWRCERQRPRQSKVGWCLSHHCMGVACGAAAVTEQVIVTEGRHSGLG